MPESSSNGDLLYTGVGTESAEFRRLVLRMCRENMHGHFSAGNTPLYLSLNCKVTLKKIERSKDFSVDRLYIQILFFYVCHPFNQNYMYFNINRDLIGSELWKY